MKAARLIQIAAGYARFDAISREMELIAEFARSGRGTPFHDAVILGERLPPGSPAHCRPLDEFRPGRGDVVLWHYGMAFDRPGMLERIKAGSGPKALVYHNLTPARFVRPYDLVLAGKLARAREELPEVVAATDAHFAVSSLNAVELEAAGAPAPIVRPVLFRPTRAVISEHRQKKKEPGREPARLFFVGRFAPNKNHRTLLMILALLNQKLPARLVLAGVRPDDADPYMRCLRQWARELGVADLVEFRFDPDGPELDRLYANADLFLCASLHEGFCVPILEAMAAELPVMACQSPESAVAETMQGAGLGFAPPISADDYSLLAGAAAVLLTDHDLRARLIAGQRRRMEAYRPDWILEEFFRSLISELRL